MAKPLAVIAKNSTNIALAVKEVLAQLQIPDLTDKKILLKPNVGREVAPKLGVNTNPDVVKAIFACPLLVVRTMSKKPFPGCQSWNCNVRSEVRSGSGVPFSRHSTRTSQVPRTLKVRGTSTYRQLIMPADDLTEFFIDSRYSGDNKSIAKHIVGLLVRS